jgi:hypothetical protein
MRILGSLADKSEISLQSLAVIIILLLRLFLLLKSFFDRDFAYFTCSNDSTTYSSISVISARRVTESLKAEMELENILVSELSPGEHVNVYI